MVQLLLYLMPLVVLMVLVLMPLMPPLASFFGFRSRTLIFLVCFFCVILFSFLVGLYCVGDTKEVLMPACYVLFWNQVIQTNQFLFLALGPLIS